MNSKPICKKYLKMCSIKKTSRDLGVVQKRRVRRIEEVKINKRSKK